jgi:GMP synthase (glutamine-hydrolysing)
VTLQTENPTTPQNPVTHPLNRQMLVILDFGSQYSELIARRIRETEVYSEVLSYRTSVEQLRQLNPQGIILSGGPNSVYADYAPHCDPAIWEMGIPILGVCYGMQLMVQQLGGGLRPPIAASTARLPSTLTTPPTYSPMWRMAPPCG